MYFWIISRIIAVLNSILDAKEFQTLKDKDVRIRINDLEPIPQTEGLIGDSQAVIISGCQRVIVKADSVEATAYFLFTCSLNLGSLQISVRPTRLMTGTGDLWTQQTKNYFRSNDAIKGLLDANS